MNSEVHTFDIRASHQRFGEIMGGAGPGGFFRRLGKTRADGGIGQHLTFGAGIQPDDMPAKSAADWAGANLTEGQLAQGGLELWHAIAGHQLPQHPAIGLGRAIADLFGQTAKGLGVRRQGGMGRQCAQMSGVHGVRIGGIGGAQDM